LDLPMGVRYAMTLTGALLTLSVMFAAGRELARWTPAPTSRGAVALAVVLPAAIGTALIILVNQPVPLSGFAAARIGESAMWLFAAVGAATAPASSHEADGRRTTLPDFAVAGIVIAVVRVMVAGIAL